MEGARGKNLFAAGKIEIVLDDLENGGKSNASRSTVLRIFIRSMRDFWQVAVQKLSILKGGAAGLVPSIRMESSGWLKAAAQKEVERETCAERFNWSFDIQQRTTGRIACHPQTVVSNALGPPSLRQFLFRTWYLRASAIAIAEAARTCGHQFDQHNPGEKATYVRPYRNSAG